MVVYEMMNEAQRQRVVRHGRAEMRSRRVPLTHSLDRCCDCYFPRVPLSLTPPKPPSIPSTTCNRTIQQQSDQWITFTNRYVIHICSSHHATPSSLGQSEVQPWAHGHKAQLLLHVVQEQSLVLEVEGAERHSLLQHVGQHLAAHIHAPEGGTEKG